MAIEYDPIDLEDLDRRKAKDVEAREHDREQEEEDMRWVMAQPQGRRLMSRILGLCGVYRSSYTGNSETFFREGMRNIGLILVADMQTLTPGDFVKLLQEHSNGRPSDSRSNRAK